MTIIENQMEHTMDNDEMEAGLYIGVIRGCRVLKAV